MRTLAIDTSYEMSVALIENGQTLAYKHISDRKNHVELLASEIMNMITPRTKVPQDFSKISFVPSRVDGNIFLYDVLPNKIEAKAVDSIVVGTGPGPFTGLRAGLITAKMFARGFDVPIYSVPSLDVELAFLVPSLSASPSTAHLAVGDAKRNQVFAKSPLLGKAIVTAPQEVLELIRDQMHKKGISSLTVGGNATDLIRPFYHVFRKESLQYTTPQTVNFQKSVFETDKFGEIMCKLAKKESPRPIYCSKPNVN